MIELCAITTSPAPPATGLQAIERGGLAALGVPPGDGDASPAELWRREELLERLMCDCDLLPVRWGTVLDDDGVEELLEARHAELQDALERVRGAVELAVRVAGGASATEVHEMLSTLARESRQLALGRGAYLVAREDVEDFVVTIAALEEANDDLSILCTGPWPPYSFVTA